MDYNADYLNILKDRVTPHRYNHTLGVIEEAITLAKIYNEDINKARIAASLHDIAKGMTYDEMEPLIKDNFGIEYLNYPFGVLHQYAGMVVARDLGVDDDDILNAIKNHSLGRPNMSLLEKIIFVSDFTEKGRELEESRIAHKIALKSLDEAIIYIYENINEYLIKNGNKVEEISLQALEFYRRKVNGS